MSGRGGLLFMDSAVERFDATVVEVEEAVELCHEVARYGAAGMVRTE